MCSWLISLGVQCALCIPVLVFQGGENSRDEYEYKKVRCLSLPIYVAIGAGDEYIFISIKSKIETITIERAPRTLAGCDDL